MFVLCLFVCYSSIVIVWFMVLLCLLHVLLLLNMYLHLRLLIDL